MKLSEKSSKVVDPQVIKSSETVTRLNCIWGIQFPSQGIPTRMKSMVDVYLTGPMGVDESVDVYDSKDFGGLGVNY